VRSGFVQQLLSEIITSERSLSVSRNSARRQSYKKGRHYEIER